MRRILQFIACVAFLTGIPAQSQPTEDQDAKAVNAIANLKMGIYGPVDPEQLAAASQPGQLIPFLEARFTHAADSNAKANIASELVRLGDKDDTYWNYLVDRATPALESDAPSPRSSEYRTWARAHSIKPGSPDEQALFTSWQNIVGLGSTEDPRAIPLLRRGLQSPNYEIQSAAAEGLGQLHDKGSIPLIIEVCKKSNADQARAIAASLKYFDDDPLAKGVVAIYFPTPDPVEALKKDADGSEDSDVRLGLDIERVVKAHAVQAIPILEQMFNKRGDDTHKPLPSGDTSPVSDQEKEDLRHLDQNNKVHIASALLRLGVKDDIYWTYLADPVRLVLDLNPPTPMQIDANGKVLPDPSPAFVAWTKAHNTTVEASASDAMFVIPEPVLFLAETADPRGIPLLRQALLSPNYFIQNAGAEGLAKLQDKDSIPLIIEACKASPQEAEVIARSLLYFDDPQAQQAAEKYMPPEMLKAFRQNKDRFDALGVSTR